MQACDTQYRKKEDTIINSRTKVRILVFLPGSQVVCVSTEILEDINDFVCKFGERGAEHRIWMGSKKAPKILQVQGAAHTPTKGMVVLNTLARGIQKYIKKYFNPKECLVETFLFFFCGSREKNGTRSILSRVSSTGFFFLFLQAPELIFRTSHHLYCPLSGTSV